MFNWGTNHDHHPGSLESETYSNWVAAVRSGIRKGLSMAQKKNISTIVVVFDDTKVPHVESVFIRPKGKRTKVLERQLAESPVKVVYEGPRVYNRKDLELAIFEACLYAGSHSLSTYPINDSLFKNGVIGVAIYGDYKMTAQGEMKGAYAHFFEDGFTDYYGEEMNNSFWTRASENGKHVYIDGLVQTLDLLLYEQYSQIRIKTSDQQVANWFKTFEKHELAADCCNECLQLRRLHVLFKSFQKVEIEFDLEDGRQSVLEAKRMVDQLFESTFNGLYWKNGVPVVYTDGSVHGKGKKAVAGGAAFWGEGDPRNRKFYITGAQTSNRGELEAVLKALEMANERHIHQLVIRTDSQYVIDSVTVMPFWKRNGWRKKNNEIVSDRDLLEKVDKLMKTVWVEFEKVRAHSGNEGNDGADELAYEAAREAFEELYYSR